MERLRGYCARTLVAVKAFIYRHRLLGKRVIACSARLLPESASRRLRALAERVAFSLTPHYQSDTLPPIFHYWSGRFLAPDAHRLGIGSPESLYIDHVRRRFRVTGQPVNVLSVGTGACSMEIALAAQLEAEGVSAKFICMDFNPGLMRKAVAAAGEQSMGERIAFQTTDCNQPFELPGQDVIIVNQFFHHVTELETLCRSLRGSLAPDGVLLSSDIIGRNGHVLWPDVEALVQRAWSSLPACKRHDRHFNNGSPRYRPIDHAAYSNEGVRAQDVVTCLLAEFDFELFFTFGGAIMPFVERRIGFNFDPADVEDCAWIDALQRDDAEALTCARYPASNMICVLRHRGCATEVQHEPVTPEQHVALTRQQLERVTGASRQTRQASE
jgi:SAM-dependent methyltransferase